MPSPVFDTPELRAFYDAHPSFDLLQCDFTGRCPADERLAAVDAATLQQLKAGQRLLRLTRDGLVANTLYACGYSSAWQVAANSEAVFVRNLGDRLPVDTVRQLHRRARGVKARMLHLWATVHNLIASPHFRESRINNVPAELTRYLSSIPDYEDLFGSLDYYEVTDCQSILSPAAYFVELLWYVDQYLDQPSTGAIPEGFRLDERRPDLKQIQLTCANTLDTVSFLEIINTVLRARVATLTSDDITLQNYPWTLPLALPWMQVRGDLAYLQVDLTKVYRTFDDGSDNHRDVIGRAETGLSLAMVELITGVVSDDAGLRALYGLDDTQTPSTVLADRDVLLEHTGLTRVQLVALLYQDLTVVEQAADLAHRLYINQVLDDEDSLSLAPESEGSTEETLQPLTNAGLDRLHRLVRLTAVLGLTFAELDTALRALGIDGDNDINPATLNALGRLRSLQRQYDLPLDALCALFADMNTLGVGDPKQPLALFDRIYNLPERMGTEPVYHPEYDGNALYRDVPIIWNADGTTADEAVFSSARLASGLGLSQGDLNALRAALWPTDTPPLDVCNLTQLYRHTLLMQQLNYPLADYTLLLYLLDIAPSPTQLAVPLLLGDGPLASLTQIETLLDTAAWLSSLNWTVRHPDYILSGREYADVSTLIPAASVAELMTDFWKQKPPTVSQDTDDLTEEQIAQLLAQLRAQLEQGLALYFGIDTQLFPGLAQWAAALTGIDNYLSLLYTPGDPEDPQIATFLTHLSRYHLLATDAGLTGSQFSSMAAYPSQYGLSVLNGASAKPTQLQLAQLPQLRPLVDFRKWVVVVGDSNDERLVAYLNTVGRGAITDVPAKVNVLAAITGWSVGELQALVTADPSIGYTADDLDTAVGLLRLDTAFTLLQAMGANVALIGPLIALGNAQAITPEDPDCAQTANAVRNLVSSQYQGDELTQVVRQLDDPLYERERDALVPWLIWMLNKQWAVNPEIDYQLNSQQDLSEYLLLDVQMQGASDSTPIKQGQLSVQMYIQRCQMGLETGVTPVPVDNLQWDWLMDYQLWEANRKIFLYPENYLDPSLRIDQSAEFVQLMNALQQGELNDERVETAFRDYLDGFETLARLQVVETARYRVGGTGIQPVDTLFVFACAITDPPVYYYRRCTDAGLSSSVWHYWEKIDVQINAPTVTPAYAFGRLFLFWTEHKEITNTDDSGAKTTEVQISIRYSFLNAYNKWVATQTLVADYVPEGISPDEIKKSLFWRRPYALVVPLDDPNDESGEQILISLGEMLDGGVLDGDGNTADNPHVWQLNEELLSKSIRLQFRSRLPVLPVLDQARGELVATTAGLPGGNHAAVFAGGRIDTDTYSNVVDIYDYQEGFSNHLSSAGGDIPHLSEARHDLAAATASLPSGSHAALFAGGDTGSLGTDVVDIYDYQDGSWRHLSSRNDPIPPLSQSRDLLAATTASLSDGGHAAIFAGGYAGPSDGYSDVVDIYENRDGIWSRLSSQNDPVPPLSYPRDSLAAATVGFPDGSHAAIFAGGFDGGYTDVVDIYECRDGSWNHLSSELGEIPPLSQPRSELAVATASLPGGGYAAIFAGGKYSNSNGYSNVVDIYERPLHDNRIYCPY